MAALDLATLKASLSVLDVEETKSFLRKKTDASGEDGQGGGRQGSRLCRAVMGAKTVQQPPRFALVLAQEGACYILLLAQARKRPLKRCLPRVLIPS